MKFPKISRRDLLKDISIFSSFFFVQKAIPSTAGGTGNPDAAHPPESVFLSGGKTLKIKFDPKNCDGPHSPLFSPVVIEGNRPLRKLVEPLVSRQMAEMLPKAPDQSRIAWGIPFVMNEKIVFIKEDPVSVSVQPFKAKWLVFLHTSDISELAGGPNGLYEPPFKGEGRLGERIADYVLVYADGTTERSPVKRRHQIGMFQRRWGENCFESVAHHKFCPIRAHHEQTTAEWGWSQTRVNPADSGEWVNWLWAWENPHPEKKIAGFRFEPVPSGGTIVLSAVTAGDVSSHPLRWQTRRKAVLSFPDRQAFNPKLDDRGLLSQIQLDMGQVISASLRLSYPDDNWARGYNNALPEVSRREVVIEYAAHPEGRFHFQDGTTLPAEGVENKKPSGRLRPVAPAARRVLIRVVEKGGGEPVAVKLHMHGEAGEYLAPMNRNRLPNDAWFEDTSVDFVHQGTHNCTYIPGETTVRLPAGKVFIEVSKGFEIRPVRQVVSILPETKEITIEIEKVLPWREKGWVTADTHVHFLSPGSALLEGSGEGVNVVNLLSSQWGELMTNMGDFDGKTTWGSREAGGDGEHLVRVGTENRQHVLGHISLLGYNGGAIVPMTTGGPDESAIGDPIDVLLTEWARQCRKQGGLVILPHFPNPRAEHAASIVSGDIDGVEMTSWGNLYAGINPYSLCDWYRYLNCGYFTAAVGGTDKMSAGTAVGTVRTYARIDDGKAFDYEGWKEAVRKGNTFVTYGPLMEFMVEGKPPGSKIKMSSNGGSVSVSWKAASVTVPMSKVELVVNGEIKESRSVRPDNDEGNWTVKADKSSWVALLIRGHYPDKPEIIAAHSSPVMIEVDGSPFYAAADATTILEQIEGSMAYLDTVGTRAEDAVYRRMRLVLESAHRSLHNRMHQFGMFHQHTPPENHPGHRRG
jgi:hypothetical protein